MSLLSEASALLTPAWLSVVGVPALRECFIIDVDDADGAAVLTLGPVAGGPVDARRVYVDFRLGGRDWQLKAEPLTPQDGQLRVRVVRGPEARPERLRRMLPQADLAVCSFVPVGTGLGRCHQPVLDLGARGLALECSVPLPVGTVLSNLAVTYHTHMLRQGEGTVVNSIQLLHISGRHSHRCGVRLRAASKPLELPVSEDTEVRDPERVQTLLWGMADVGCAMSLHIGSEEIHGRLLHAKGSRAGMPALQCQFPPDTVVPAGVAQVALTLYGVGYGFLARARPQEGGRVSLHPAPVLHQNFRREEERWQIPADAGAVVRWRHPLDGSVSQRVVTNLSGDGFAFESLPDDVVWPGMPLDGVHLQLPGMALSPGSSVVRSVHGQVVGVEMGALPELDADRLRQELLQRRDPHLAFQDGDNLDAVLALHRKVHLLEPAMEANLLANLPVTRRTWRDAHHHPDGLVRTAVGLRNGEVIASLNLVRAYDRGWCLQHGAVLHPTARPTTADLYTALTGLVYPRDDGEYLCAFVSDGARSQHAVIDTFFAAHSTPEHRGRHRFSLYVATGAPTTPPPGADLRRLRGSDEVVVMNAARRVLHPVCARALGLQAGEVELPASRAAFRKVGLERGREAWGVFRDHACVAVLLREWASPGLSLSSILSASLLLPVRPELDPQGVLRAALVSLALTLPLHGNPPSRLLLTPEETAGEPILAAGFRRAAGCCLYAFHRHGLREYHHYMATRYGLAHAMLRVGPEAA